jgi:hypothetical protein
MKSRKSMKRKSRVRLFGLSSNKNRTKFTLHKFKTSKIGKKSFYRGMHYKERIMHLVHADKKTKEALGKSFGGLSSKNRNSLTKMFKSKEAFEFFSKLSDKDKAKTLELMTQAQEEAYPNMHWLTQSMKAAKI